MNRRQAKKIAHRIAELNLMEWLLRHEGDDDDTSDEDYTKIEDAVEDLIEYHRLRGR